jgi:very-short-patch-repair endonuclease
VRFFRFPPSFKGKGVRGRFLFFMIRRGKIVRGQTVQPSKLLLAKQLRHGMTAAERRLWIALRRNGLDGFHFRRQQVIGGYIVDFYCNTAKLAIEVDGGVHQDQGKYDELRDGVLERKGVHVVRISNEAMYDVEAVIEYIKERIEEAVRKKPKPRRYA